MSHNTAQNILALLLSFYIVLNAFVIDPATVDEYATVRLLHDPRGLNKIVNNSFWKINQDINDPLYDWSLELTLDYQQYGFRNIDNNVNGSTISIEINAFDVTNECDGYFAFSIGDQQYFTFVTDFDGYFNANLGDDDGTGSNEGIFIYPNCNSDSIISGNASQLISNISQPMSSSKIRDALSGGDDANWYKLTTIQNGNNFPITFNLINNYESNTFTFEFISPTFDGTVNQSLKCQYNSSVPTDEDIKLYLSTDLGNETMAITSFSINRYDISPHYISYQIMMTK